ncbi:hypothetical protein CPLU01_14279 [Colletotrichum plurivorum]|uniref:Uncharacterized protein n=1 Tax=Colletotrichum plurivorum TaxID=2175906 RepID=A0A8H6JL97_9PEZI|nr:hypothetical protein CPLU01_14279 [Colletotrichum plurivorum]
MPLLPAGPRTSAPDIYEDALEWSSLLLPADVSSTTSFESKANVDINDGIRSRVPRRSSNPRTSSDIEAPKKTLPLLGELYTSDELYLARLSQLCLPDWTFRQQFLQSSQGILAVRADLKVLAGRQHRRIHATLLAQRAGRGTIDSPASEASGWMHCSNRIRPERPEFSIKIQKPSSEAWNRALRRVQQGFFVGGPFETILDGEKKTRKMLFKVDLSEDSLLDPASLFVPHKPVLCAVSIIVYDIEARERPGSVHDGDEERHGLREGAGAMFDALAKRVNPIMEFKKHFRGLADVIFRHMLLTDYGMEKPPIHFQFGYREDAKNEWPHLWCVSNELCAVVSGFAECLLAVYLAIPKVLVLPSSRILDLHLFVHREYPVEVQLLMQPVMLQQHVVVL